MTKRDAAYYILLGMFLQLLLGGSYDYLYKIAKRSWLINDSLLRLNSVPNK